MHKLLELALCIDEEREILEDINIKDDKVFRLYELILEGKKSDEEIAKELMPDSSNPYKAFWVIQKRLYDRLVNTLLSTKMSGSEIKKAHFDCYRSIAAFKILRGSEKRQASLVVAERTIKKAINYHFTDVVHDLAKTLRYHYATIQPSKKSFKKYDELAKRYKLTYEIETKLEEDYHYFLYVLNTKNNYNKHDRANFSEFAARASEAREKSKSYQLYLLSGQTLAYYYHIENDIEKLIEVCRSTIDYFETLPNLGLAAKFSFRFKIIPAYISLGEYLKAESIIKECLNMVSPHRVNYQRILEYYITLKLYEGDFDKSKELINMVSNKGNKERFLMMEAYYNILSGNAFKLGRFLNEVPVFAMDKRGMNINILIIQILTYLVRNQHGKVIDRMLALERYTYRHLRADDTKRANLFIQMLLTLEKGRFKKISVQERSKKLLSKLKRTEITIQDVYNEVVPYERLWEFVMGRLG